MTKAEVIFENYNTMICNDYHVFLFVGGNWHVVKNGETKHIASDMKSAIKYCLEN